MASDWANPPKVTLPYLTPLPLTTSDIIQSEEELLLQSFRDEFLTIKALTYRENAKVSKYLELLGKSQQEDELLRQLERERERVQDAERRQISEYLFSEISSPNKDMTHRKRTEKHKKNGNDDEEIEEEVEERDTPSSKRRQSRSTAAELEAKLEALRRDPNKRAELEDRITRYKNRRNQITELKNLVEENKKNVFREHTPDTRIRKIRDWWVQHSEKINEVIESKKQLDRDYLERKIRIVHRKEIQEEELKREKMLELQKLHLQNRQRKWLVVVAMASRLSLMMNAVEQDQIIRTQYKKETEACRKVQKCWRDYIRRKEATIWRKRMVVVHRTLRKWIIRFRVKRKRKAADMIHNFLTDLQDVNRIVQVVKRFRFLVRQSQYYWRKYKEVDHAQLAILRVQWDTVEEELRTILKAKLEEEQKKEDIMKNALNYQSSAVKKRKQHLFNHTMSRKDTSRGRQQSAKSKKEITIPKVSESVKTKLLVESLRARHKEYASKLSVYKKAISKYEQQAKTKAAIEMARKQISENPSEAFPESSESSQNPTRPGTSQSSVKKLPVIITASAFSKLTSTQEKKRQLSAQKKGQSKSGKKKSKRDDGRPIHPGLFHVLLPKSDMIRLIEQGMREMEEDIKLIHIPTDRLEEAEEVMVPISKNDTSTENDEEDSEEDTDSESADEL